MRTGYLEIDAEPVQHLMPEGAASRFEGIGFSPSGIIAVATSDADTVLFFRPAADGRYENTPYWKIGGANSGLKYPHDVSFSADGETELLAVAQRGGAIAIYAKHRDSGHFGSESVFAISGPESKLAFSDGVAFVPPHNDYLAACNLELGTVTFYRKTSSSPVRFETTPEFVLKHSDIRQPDGLAFSACGGWLAVANHGSHSATVFKRARGDKPRYGPRPVTVIEDSDLRHPHSVVFTPCTGHLVVTSAGANYFGAYKPKRSFFGTQWSQTSASRTIAGPEDVFREVNSLNKMEGGPKGIAIHQDLLAICSAQFGLNIYRFREGAG